jgi:hypothetical protein
MILKASTIRSVFAAAAICVVTMASAQTSNKLVYTYKQITAVESVVPGGMGRSRVLTTDDSGQMMERDLKNFYSMVGINFGNIANNDRAIMDRLNEYAEQGWELANVVTGSNEQTSGASIAVGCLSRGIY